VITRPAEMSDRWELIEIAKGWARETRYGTEFDMTEALQYLGAFIEFDGHDILLAIDDDGVAGLVMVAASNMIYKKPLGYVIQFYVIERARKGVASKHLIAALKLWFAAQEVSQVFVTANAGLKDRDQRAFIAIMKRSGFEEAGPSLYWDMR